MNCRVSFRSRAIDLRQKARQRRSQLMSNVSDKTMLRRQRLIEPGHKFIYRLGDVAQLGRSGTRVDRPQVVPAA